MLAESLLNILAVLISEPVSQSSDKHISQGKHEYIFNTIYQV